MGRKINKYLSNLHERRMSNLNLQSSHVVLRIYYLDRRITDSYAYLEIMYLEYLDMA